MGKRAEWIIKLVDPAVRWDPTYRLARVVGTQTAARWEREARTMRPAVLRRKVQQDHQN